ncbi:MAG: penicillin-binding protein 1C [Pseudomonadota bacterium]
MAVLNTLFPPNLERLNERSTVVYDQEGEPLHVSCSSNQDLWCLPVKANQVDLNFLKHLILIEDKRFWSHWGVDLGSMLRALYQLARNRKVISGASTLTMQTVRLLEPRPRTVTSKVIEMFRAWQLEWHFTKTQILEMYLTLAPYGGNITGVWAAATTYFGHRPNRLTPAESAMLVALPRAPTKLRPDRAPLRLQKLRNRVLRKLHQHNLVTLSQMQEAQNQSIPTRRFAFPKRVPHLARRLRFAHPKMFEHHSFIDAQIQQSVKEIVRAAIVPKSSASIAVLVLDNQTQQVCAYVGSRNFWSKMSCGQMDYIRAIRSPGSTLKPFVYGMGFDQGLIHPQTLLKDLPQRYGAYAPSNFDHSFHGELTVAEALRKSLNIPAVTVLNTVGPLHFVSHLQQTGVRLRMPYQGAAPNLAISLGGVGMSLEELVLLYSTLGHHGEVKPLHYSDEVAFGLHSQLLSGQAAQHLRSILTLSDHFSPLSAGHRGEFALKTGTSHGHRDAWAIGVGSGYTVGVWMGCPNNASLRGSTGLSAAVPIINKVFQVLPTRVCHPVVAKSSSDIHTPYQLKSHVVQSQLSVHHMPESLTIQFPVNGTVLQPTRNELGEFHPVSLVVQGQKGEVTWLINGCTTGLVKERHRILWVPPSIGFYSLVAIDAAGYQAKVEVEIQAGW